MFRSPFWYLRKIDLFGDLSDSELEKTLKKMQHCTLPKKHIIFGPNEPSTLTHILKDGEVLLYRESTPGKRVIIDILKPGSVFGNIGFSSNETSQIIAEVTEESFICTLEQDFFIRLLETYPSIAVKAFLQLQKRIEQHESRLEWLSALNADEKILVTIHLINKKDEQSILPALLRKCTKITHEKLAQLTGLTRETVTKQLQLLEQQGLTNSNKKCLYLTRKGIEHINNDNK